MKSRLCINGLGVGKGDCGSEIVQPGSTFHVTVPVSCYDDICIAGWLESIIHS